MTVTAARVTPDLLKSNLLALEEEIESRSEALPPDDRTFDVWKDRLDLLWDQVQLLRREARHRLWAIVERVAAQIESLRKATASFHAYSPPLDGVALAGGASARTVLSAAISGALASVVPPAPTTPRAKLGKAKPKPNDTRVAAADLEPHRARLSAQAARPEPAIVSPPPRAMSLSRQATRPERKIEVQAKPGLGLVTKPAHTSSVSYRPLHIAHAPVARSRRTDPIVAYVGRLARPNTFDEAYAIACTWLRSRRFKLPDDVSGDFECKGPGDDRVVVVRYEGIWAMQADTFESPTDRRWRLEMVLLEDSTSAPALSLVLHATGPADQAVPEPSIPRLAGELIDRIGLIDLRDGTTLSIAPEQIESESDVDSLVAKLRSPDRQHPIIVQSQYLKEGVAKTLLDPAGLAERLRGLAHVVTLGREHFASWALTDRLSKRFSVFGASLRLYRPGFTTEDDPESHPLWTPTALRQRNAGLPWLQSELLREAAASSLMVLGSGDDVPAFDDVQKAVLKRRIAQAQFGQGTPVDTTSFKERITRLEHALSEADTLANIFSKEKDELKDKLADAIALRDATTAKVIYLEDRVQMLEQLNSAAAGTRVELPDIWDGLEDWATEHLGKRVVITPKAARAARRSPFENISFGYEVLLFLANTYVPYRRGELKDGKDALEQEQLRLGIEISGVGNAVQTRRWRDTYSTPYKTGQVPLDMHVSGRNDRDRRYGFRLYFYWDDKEKCVVVGSFPSHLDNSLS